jgi:hypothetical protein
MVAVTAAVPIVAVFTAAVVTVAVVTAAVAMAAVAAVVTSGVDPTACNPGWSLVRIARGAVTSRKAVDWRLPISTEVAWA